MVSHLAMATVAEESATWLAGRTKDRLSRRVRGSERGEGRVAREGAYVRAEFAAVGCVGAASPKGL